MAPGLHAQNKASQNTAGESVASQLKSRPFASASDREQQTPHSTAQQKNASSVSHNLNNISVLPSTSASTQPIQMAGFVPGPTTWRTNLKPTNVKTTSPTPTTANAQDGPSDELKRKLERAQALSAGRNPEERNKISKSLAAASGRAKLRNAVFAEKNGMDLNTRYNLSPLAAPGKTADIVANARNPDLIINKGAEAQKLQAQGQFAPDPMEGLIHHHHRTTKQLDAAQSNFDLKAKIDQEQDPQKKEELQHQHFAQRFKQGMPSTNVTKIITPKDADTLLQGQKQKDRNGNDKDPSITGFYASEKFSKDQSAAQSVHQFGLGYGWEEKQQGSWGHQIKNGRDLASPYLEQDPSKNPKTESGLKAIDKLHYVKTKMTPELNKTTTIPMVPKMREAIEQRANPALGNQHPYAKEATEKASQVFKRTSEYKGDNPYTGTGSSNYGPELEAKKPQDRVNANLITEVTAGSVGTALQSGTLHERTKAGKDKQVARFNPATKTFLTPAKEKLKQKN